MASLAVRIASKFSSLGETTRERLLGLPKACLAVIASRFNRLGEMAWMGLLGLPKACLASPVVNGLGRLVARHYLASPAPLRDAARRKLLILRNQYYAADQSQRSNEVLLLDNTLRASGLADYEVLTYDSDLGISPYSDLQLIRKCSEMRPDIVVFSSWWSYPTHPSVEALRFVRHRLGIPVAMIWWDTCNNGFWPSVAPLIGEIDVHVVGENPRGHCLDKSHPLFDRFLLLWAPMDPDLFHVVDRPRDIPISFIGQVRSYRAYRREYLQYLSDHGVAGRFCCSDEEGQVSHAQYAEIIRRSQMCVNFSYSVDAHQFKGRVLEAMFCGALLLESENDQTSVLFKPMVDYIPFSSKEDLLDKVKYLQLHPQEMAAIALNGTRKAHARYSGKAFWEAIFRKVGLQ